MNFFHDLFARFTSAVRTILGFVLPIAESDAGKIIADALPLATQIVTAVATQGLKGTTARDAAVEQLKTQITNQGLADVSSIAGSTLNFIIETAVNHLNSTKS